MKNDKTIKSIFRSFEVLMLSIIIITEIAVLTSIFAVFIQNKNSTVSLIANQTVFAIQEKTSQIEYIAQELSLKRGLSEFWKEKEDRNTDSLLSIYDYISNAQNSKENVLYAFLVDNNNRTIRLTNNTNNEEGEGLIKYISEHLNENYANTRSLNSFVYVVDNQYKELYLCTTAPVREYNYKEITYEHKGTLTVCTKISANKLMMGLDRIKDIEIDVYDLKKRDTSVSNQSFFDKYLTDKAQSNISIKNLGVDIRCRVTLTDQIRNNVFVYFAVLAATLIAGINVYRLRKRINSQVLLPITQIIDCMDDFNIFGKERFGEFGGVEEIERLNRHIISMMNDIKKSSRKLVVQQQELYESELLNKEYMYMMLQNQVNPHFLYNTLNCMYSIALVYDIDEVCEICQALSTIMTYTLDNGRNVTIGEEISIVELYIRIMKIRFPDMVNISIDIPEELKSEKIIRMSVQPIAENAFNHGNFYKKKDGVLQIFVERDEDKLIMHVRDNGNGIKKDKLRELNNKLENKYFVQKASRGLGLANINNRIKYEYGDEYGIVISSIEGEYTDVKVIYPKKNSN